MIDRSWQQWVLSFILFALVICWLALGFGPWQFGVVEFADVASTIGITITRGHVLTGQLEYLSAVDGRWKPMRPLRVDADGVRVQ